mgnify:FL=1
MAYIQIDGLCKDIAGMPILKDINLCMTPGKIYGLRGKNGCGKTMLLRSICGLISPTKGTITINDKILHKDISIPESIGALIENPAFLDEYTGMQNLQILAELGEVCSKEAVSIALDRVGLTEDRGKLYRKYSLGMKQKLGIANAIMNEPDIIILDEPINALDEDSVGVIRNSLFELRDKGSLIIVACHDREELDYLSDEIYVMAHGEIIRKENS